MNWDIDRIQGSQGPLPVQPVKSPSVDSRKTGTKESFQDVLSRTGQKVSQPDVTISSHASQRLMQRGISLDASDMQKIDEGLNRAAEKGAKESLFMLRDLALVVSVENRTVITALQGDSAKNNVFTNIDSAVVL